MEKIGEWNPYKNSKTQHFESFQIIDGLHFFEYFDIAGDWEDIKYLVLKTQNGYFLVYPPKYIGFFGKISSFSTFDPNYSYIQKIDEKFGFESLEKILEHYDFENLSPINTIKNSIIEVGKNYTNQNNKTKKIKSLGEKIWGKNTFQRKMKIGKIEKIIGIPKQKTLKPDFKTQFIPDLLKILK